MTRIGIGIVLGTLAVFSQGVSAQDAKVETGKVEDTNALRTEAMPADAVVDEGTLDIKGAAGFSRSEDFVILKRPDGGFSLLSRIQADDGSYEATATWIYDDQWRAVSATGLSTTKGTKRKIEVRRSGDSVVITRATTPPGSDATFDEITAACDQNCLIDMTPAALPMSIMVRRFDAARGGAQPFKWVGVSLINDQVLTDGTATLSFNRALNVKGGGIGDISHWRFVEDLKDNATGQAYQMNAHLWTDTAANLRKFGMGRSPKPSTIGIRITDEDYSAEMPAE